MREQFRQIIRSIWIESGESFDLQNATKRLEQFFGFSSNDLISLKDLLKYIARYYHVPYRRVKNGNDGTGKVVLTRRVFYYIARKLRHDITLQTLGEVVNQSSSNVYHSLRIITDQMEIYKNFQQEVETLLLEVKQLSEQSNFSPDAD